MEYTLIIRKDGAERTFTRRGVIDLFELLTNEPKALYGASITDKAIGKAAAALMVLGGVKEAATPRISTPALKLFRRAGIKVDYDEEVPLILNRDKSDFCPMEKRCMVSDNPQELLPIITEFINEIKKRQ
jgi:iron complex outermembrane receptor protein